MILRYLLTASILGLIVAVLTRGGVFLANVIFARNMPVEEYGLLSFAYLTAMNLGGFVSAGLSQTASKITSESNNSSHLLQENLRKIAVVSVSAIFLISLLIIGFRAVIADNVVGHPELSSLLVISSLVLSLTVGAGVAQAVLFSVGHLKIYLFVSILSVLVMLCAVWGSLSWRRADYSLLALGTSSAIQFAFFLMFIRYKYFKDIRTQRDKYLQNAGWRGYAQIMKYLGPSLLIAAVGAPVHWFCMSILASMSGGISNIAVFNAAFQWYLFVSFVPAAIGNMSISFFGKFASSKSDEGLTPEKMLSFSLIAITLVSILVGLPALLVPEWLIGLYGDGYSDAAPVVSVLAMAGMVTGLTLSMQHYFSAIGHIWWNFGVSCFYAFVYLSLTYVAAFLQAGPFGVALAFLFAIVLMFLLQASIFWRKNRCLR